MQLEKNIALDRDQIVLVTAGASGIGRCIAEKFLSHGCRVHICDIDQNAIDEFLTDNPNASASMAVFLASAMGAGISGQAIGVDGHTESLSNVMDR